MPIQETAAAIINDAAVELGLRSSDLTDPFASTDQNIIQLCRLFNGVGRDLVQEHNWSALTVGAGFNTAAGTVGYLAGAFALNSSGGRDFNRMVDATMWNTTRKRQMYAVNRQQLQVLTNEAASSGMEQYFWTSGEYILVSPTPTAVETVIYYYVSNGWVNVEGQGDYVDDHATMATDKVLHPRRLMVAALKLRFKQAKGFDSSADQAVYDRVLDLTRAQDQAGATISMAGPAPLKLIDSSNVPETGFGG